MRRRLAPAPPTRKGSPTGIVTKKKCKNKTCAVRRLRNSVIETPSGFIVCVKCGMRQGFAGYVQSTPHRDTRKESEDLVTFSATHRGDDAYNQMAGPEAERTNATVVAGYRAIKYLHRVCSCINSLRSVVQERLTLKMRIVQQGWKRYVRAHKDFRRRQRREQYHAAFTYWLLVLEEDVGGMQCIQREVDGCASIILKLRKEVEGFPSLATVMLLHTRACIREICDNYWGREKLQAMCCDVVARVGVPRTRNVVNVASGCVWMVYDGFRSCHTDTESESLGIGRSLTQESLAKLTGSTPSTLSTCSLELMHKYASDPEA